MFLGCHLPPLHSLPLSCAQSGLPPGSGSANSLQHLDGQDKPGRRLSGGGSRWVQHQRFLTFKSQRMIKQNALLEGKFEAHDVDVDTF